MTVDDDEVELGRDWQVAAKYAEPLGRIHPFFYGSVRVARSPQQPDVLTNFNLLTLLKSRRMQAIVYHATIAFGLKTAEELEQMSGEDILRAIPSPEICAIVSLAYLNKKIKDLCSEKIWTPTRTDMLFQLEVGALIGRSLPNIGPARGVILGGARPLSAALLGVGDERKFTSYRVHLNKANRLFDMEYEREHFGCTHLQVLGYILQRFCFGVQSARAVGIAIEITDSIGDLTEDGPSWVAGAQWIRSVLEDEKAPEKLPSPDFSLSDEQLQQLFAKMGSVEFEPQETAWFERKQDEMPESVAKAFEKLIWPSR